MRCFLLTIIFATLFFYSNGQKTIIIQPGPAEGKDAYINSAYPDNAAGSHPGMVACAWTFNGIFGIGRSLIRFDLSQIPSDAEILDARLTLFYDPDIAYGMQSGENASYLEKVTEDWNEMNVTWNSQPTSTSSGSLFIAATQTSSQDLANIDVTGFVSDWILHPESNFGLIHRMATELEYCCLVFSSSDKPVSDKRPKLVVTYRDCEPPVAEFSYFIQISSVNFTNASTSASAWFWDFGDGYFSNLENPQHIYASQGTYMVCLSISDSCGLDTICQTVHVCEMPEPHFNYSANAQLVSFRDSSWLPQSWFWDFNDGFYSDLKDPQHFFNQPGTYFVCEKVTNACGVQTFCDSLTVITSAIDDRTNAYCLSLYPNPAHDRVFLHLKVQSRKTGTIELFTPQNVSVGRWILEILPGDVPTSLNFAGLSKGIYFLRTKIDGTILLNKLIIV